MNGFTPPGDCPTCGEFVPPGACSCPHCGADERTGWHEDTYLDGVDLPGDDNGEYARYAEREFGSGLPRGGRGWLTAAIALVLALVLSGVWLVLR